MKSFVVLGSSSVVRRIKRFLLFTFSFSLFTFVACSMPNLEKPECAASGLAVKEFYSYHFGNEMQPTKENLQKRERFLTANLRQQLEAQTSERKDYFTQTEDYPKAFRIGKCEVAAPDKTVYQIVFFWKDDQRSEQRDVNVEMQRENDKWLVNRIY